MMKFGKKFLSWGFVPALLALCGCAASTDSIASVRNFDSKRYLGTWYEIARLPHRFERDLDFVSAHYSEQGDGTIRVVNRGQRDGKEREAVGKAHFKGASDVGELRVSFFGPFYGDYRIIDLAPDYSHAVVTSGTMDYLWILSRTPQLPQERLSAILEQLRSRGFDIGRLEYPKQETAPCSSAK